MKKVKQTFNGNGAVFHYSGVFLERARLHSLLEGAIKYPLVAVYAGSGYGKTYAVHSFMQKYVALATWVQITERDNVGTRFWENFAHAMSLSWPEAGARLLEIGFPDTKEAFAKFEAIIQEIIAAAGEHVIVFDDFHLLYNPIVLNFFEKALRTIPPNGSMILISRTMPEINMFGLMMQDRVFTIREDALCFTEDEIGAYFKQLGLTVARQDIRDIYDDTRGWAFAINLIGRSLGKEKKYERYALEAMKTNIYKLIETEISQTVSKPLWRFLLRISLIDHFAVSLIKVLANDDALIKEMEILNAYISYDHYLGAYMIHHLFLDYLRQNQHILTDKEKQDTWQIAGAWCKNNKYLADALSYFEKAGDYTTIMNIVYSLNMPTPLDMARYALVILSRIPQEAAKEYPLFPAMDLKLRMSLGFLGETSALAEQYVKEYEARPESQANDRALGAIYCIWATLRMIMSPYTDVYDFDEYFKKMRTYYDKHPYIAYGPHTHQAVGAYALLVGTNRAEAVEEYCQALSRAIPHSAHVLKGNLYGLDDLVRGELYFCRREFNEAEKFLNQALSKAREKNQYDIQNRALLYLMLLSFSHGDISDANNFLQKLEALLEEKEYPNRYEAYDVARSHYYLALGQPEQIPDWLKGDFSSYAHPAFFENYANRVKAQYRYQTRQYNELLAFLENERGSQKVLYGSIAFKVLEALCLYQLKRREEAISALAQAYDLAAPNGIVSPFTQYAKDMRTLTAAALKEENCPIPKAWLENINRKASAYSKRVSHMVSNYKVANNIENEINLTKREIEILRDLSQGLSRTEIAASQNISANTVKMVISIIYEKLSANNLADAIRIAIDHKIV